MLFRSGKGARRPRAVLAPVVGDIEANMATMSRRTGDGWPVWRPVAIPVPGFGGSGMYCGHAPSYQHYVGTVLVGAVLAGFWEPAFFMAGFWESAFFMAGFWESAFFMAGFWESAFFMAGFWESVLLGLAPWSRLSRIFLGRGF